MDEKQADASWERGVKWAKRALQLAVLVGTAFVMIYFIRIRSVPVDNLSGIAGIATIIVAVSLVFYISMAISWGFPGGVFKFLLTLDKELFGAWFMGGGSHVLDRQASFARAVSWSLAIIVSPWIALSSTFAPDAFGSPLTNFVIFVACLVFTGVICGLYALDRPLYDLRERPRLKAIEGD